MLSGMLVFNLISPRADHRLRAGLCPGDYKTQFHAKAAAIADALAGDCYDFGFLHVKAVDDTGHDRAAAMKVNPAMLSRILEALCSLT